MNRVWLIFEARRDVVFTATAATLGGRETLSHIPGSTLLGWTAARLYRDLPPYDAFTLFHSGKVRFGNGWPLTASNRPAFPVPLVWREKKRDRGGIEADDQSTYRVVTLNVRNYNPKFEPDHFKDQAEILKGWYIAADGTAVRPDRGTRGKTAIDPGTRRAADGQYFAYDYLTSGNRFAALIEADATVDHALWQKITDLFAKAGAAGLRLGRSAGTEFGGDFSVTVHSVTEDDHRTPPFQPTDTDRHGNQPTEDRCVTLWCLSDLALDDPQTLTPCLIPTGAAFGLRHGRFNASKSVIATRRYAPYNLKLDAVDLDRCVIAGGSVLTFEGLDARDYARLIDCVERGAGLYREGGLGRLWLNPQPLKTAMPCFAASRETAHFPVIALTVTPRPRLAPYDVMIKNLEDWAKARLATVTKTDDLHRKASGNAAELKKLLKQLKTAKEPVSSRNQWAMLSTMCRENKRLLDILDPTKGFLRRPEWQSLLLGNLPDGDPRSLKEWFEAYSKTDTNSAEILALTADLVHKHRGEAAS